MSREHLDYYLDEYAFRFNRRTSRYRGKLFCRLVQKAAAAEAVSYSAPAKNVRGPKPKNTICRGQLELRGYRYQRRVGQGEVELIVGWLDEAVVR